MKLKRLPDDFRVEELADFPVSGGPFALYRLEKRSLGTLEAVEAVARKWDIARERIAFGGLKDKHAVSRQFLTIEGGPARHLRQTNFELAFLGQAPRPFSTEDIQGNRFEMTLRDLGPRELEFALQGCEEAARDGLPNYFDDQRFGSVGTSGEFMALPWCRGDFERALWLALAEVNPRDRPREREEKQILREQWGNWQACQRALADTPLAGVVNFLARNPRNFRMAITYIRQDLRSLYLAAFQSSLWNKMLAALLDSALKPEQLWLAELGGERLPFYRGLTPTQRDELASTTLPLPSARLHLVEGPSPIKSLIESVLSQQGLALRELRVKYPRDSFFSKGDRAATFVPQNLQTDDGDDELYEGRHKLALSFDLPRGSYATILVKRITLAPIPEVP